MTDLSSTILVTCCIENFLNISGAKSLNTRISTTMSSNILYISSPLLISSTPSGMSTSRASTSKTDTGTRRGAGSRKWLQEEAKSCWTVYLLLILDIRVLM